MSDMEFNKIFAAILIAGIIAMFAGFIADNIIHAHDLAEDAVKIEGVESVAGGAAKAALPEPILHLIATADVAQGEKLSKVCASCHTFESGGPDGVGPNLWGTLGNKKGHATGFAYSEGLVALGGSWDYNALNKFLWKPKAYIDGTKMNFVGLKKPEDRAAVIAWLRTKSGSPAGLPSESEIATEKAELAPEVLEETATAPVEEAPKAEAAH